MRGRCWVWAALIAAVLAAGCGGGTEPPSPRSRATPPAEAPAPAPPRRPTRPVLIAALGDSITAGSPLWDPRPAVRERLGDSVNRQSQYEFWARRRLGAFARFRNCGVFGQTTAQIAARLESCSAGAQALVVQGGINDIAQGRSVAAAGDNLRDIVRRAKAKGLRVAMVEVLPWNQGYPRAAPAIERLNRRIATIARSERVSLFPWYRTLEDPARPGRMRADWTIDGSHPSVIGYRRLGYVVELP